MNFFIIIQTVFCLSLPYGNTIFNTNLDKDKCKVSLEIENQKSKYHFGGSRFNQRHGLRVQDEMAVSHLLSKDWSDYNLKTVVIDAGHGGKDPGAMKGKVVEKNINLNIALKLGAYIKANFPQVNVVYTRNTDTFIGLDMRAKIANDKKADLFISIHCNYFKRTSVSGTEVYVLGLETQSENMDVIKRENDVVMLEEDYEQKYEEYGVDKANPLYDILVNSYQNAHLNQSLEFSGLLDYKFKSSGRKSRGILQNKFVVLKRTAMPSVLVEVGYLSNTDELTYLSSSAGQNGVAYDIYSSFADYKRKVDGKENAPSKYDNYGTRGDSENSSAPRLANPQSNIIFGIQLAASKVKLDLDSPDWRPYRDRISIEKNEEGFFRYVIKDFGGDYYLSENECENIKKGTFNESYVVAYMNGLRIEVDEAKRILGIK